MPDDQFPDGKLNDEDEGTTGLAINVQNGKVFVHFDKPVVWFALNGDEAVEVAKLLIKHGREAGVTKPIVLEV